MPSATLDDIEISEPVPPKPTRRVIVRETSDEEAALEVCDFIARCVLDRGSEFFDG